MLTVRIEYEVFKNIKKYDLVVDVQEIPLISPIHIDKVIDLF